MPEAADHRTDLQLVEAINTGDQQAFAVLYQRHKDWVMNLAWRWTGNHDDAQDVVQETFAYLVRKFPGFQLTAQLTTFLYPAVRNLSIAARKKRQRSTGADVDPEALVQTQPEATGPRDEFATLLANLSDAHREILLMRFVDDMTQPEIAAALDLPLGTVKSRLHHAVQAVRNSPAVAALLAKE